METDKPFEIVGFIKKCELIKTLSEKIIPNTFVFEALSPFPGYHGENQPGNVIPEFLFFMVAKHYKNHSIVRITQKINKYFSDEFVGEYASIKYHNDAHPAIRIKKLKSLDYLASLQACYIDEGIEFLKPSNIQTDSVMQVQKFFHLTKCSDCNDFYFDAQNPKISYFTMPKYMKWAQFSEITKKVKNNLESNNFDAAQAGFFTNNGIVDLIRIYTKNQSTDYLKEIKSKYLDVISIME